GRGEDLDQGVILAKGLSCRRLGLSCSFRAPRERDREVTSEGNCLRAALAVDRACAKTGRGEHRRCHRGQYAPQQWPVQSWANPAGGWTAWMHLLVYKQTQNSTLIMRLIRSSSPLPSLLL